VISCSKGIERGSCALMSQVLADTLPQARVAILSGPSFAAEIAVDLPAGVTLACADPVLGARLEQAIGSARFRVYLSDDVVGAQVSGVMKNVLAIACGIVTGKGLGNSMRAMLLARGLAEAVDLGLALGARLETFLGLSASATSTCPATAPVAQHVARHGTRPRPHAGADPRRAHHRAGGRALRERHRRTGRPARRRHADRRAGRPGAEPWADPDRNSTR